MVCNQRRTYAEGKLAEFELVYLFQLVGYDTQTMTSSTRSLSWKWWGIGLLAPLIMVVGLIAGLRSYLGVRHYTNSPEDLRDLRAMIYTWHPLLSALDKHVLEKGVSPRELNELKLPYAHYLEDVVNSGQKHPIYYHTESGTNFQLYIKIGWDAGLRYDSLDNKWAYDPGDGSEGFIIKP